MKPAKFIGGLDFSVVVVHLSKLLKLFSGLMTVPLAVSLIYGEWNLLLVGVLIVGASFLVGSLGMRIAAGAGELKEVLVVTALSYLQFAVLGSFLFLGEASWIDGLFESMSGITTTGLTVLQPENLPATLVFYRAYSQWIGGLGIVVISLIVLLAPGRKSLELFSVEAGGKNIVGDVIATARVVLVTYGLLTVGMLAVYLAAGLGLFDSVVHAFTTVSTGGFSSFDSSLGELDSVLVRNLALVMMFFGAVGYPSYYLARTEGVRKFFSDSQVGLLFAIPAVAILVLLALGFSTSLTLSDDLFHLVSALTTTGFSVSGTDTWSPGTRLMTMFLMVLGGCTGSTSGGIKLIRFILFLRLIHWFVIRPLLPSETKLSLKNNGVAVGDREIKLTFAFLGLYLGLILASGFILTAYGFAPLDSFFEAVSAVGTVGLSAGVTSAELATGAKLVLILDMWAGRLEILPVMVFVYFMIWNPVRSRI